MIYEYRAKSCPEQCVAEVFCSAAAAPGNVEKDDYDSGRMYCYHDHQFRRVFSSRVVSRYKTVHAPDTRNEREFTSRREFSRFLADESKRAEDRTGVPHDFQPVDLHDPAVMPDMTDADA